MAAEERICWGFGSRDYDEGIQILREPYMAVPRRIVNEVDIVEHCPAANMGEDRDDSS